jgi:hypothetical protein
MLGKQTQTKYTKEIYLCSLENLVIVAMRPQDTLTFYAHDDRIELFSHQTSLYYMERQTFTILEPTIFPITLANTNFLLSVKLGKFVLFFYGHITKILCYSTFILKNDICNFLKKYKKKV